MARANPYSFIYRKTWTNISSNSMKPLFPEGIVVFLPVSLSRLSFLVHNGKQQFVGIAQLMSDKEIFLLSESYRYQRIKDLFF